MADLWIPPSAAAPAYFCRLCRSTFNDREERAYERHVVRCGNDHEQEIHEMSMKTKAPGLVVGDEEKEAWARRHRKSPY